MTLIAILGTDGSGKTTAARAVVKDLRSRGIKARYFEIAGGRPPANMVAHLLGREVHTHLLSRIDRLLA